MGLIFKSIIIFTVLLSTNLFAAKNLYLSYLEVPKKVYKNQRFKIKIKALITSSDFKDISTSFSDTKNISVLNPSSPWVSISENIYQNTFYFKVKSEQFKIPNITASLIKYDLPIESSTLQSVKIKYSDIAGNDKRFSNVIASDLVLKAYKTKQYNNKESLTIIDIDAVDSNLENFYIEGIQEQGTSKIKEEFSKQNLIYYFIMPVQKKKVLFKYYNTKTKSFVNITIPLILQNELVSTQTDLNPNDSSFEKYKKVAIVILLILTIFLYVWKRKRSYLFLTLVMLIITTLYLMPYQRGYVKKGSYIYILPTKNSTIFFKLDKKEKVDVLNKKKDFIKVMGIENKFIGWIKEDNFGKN